MEDYDLSHSELATLLNISRSMASMVVSGRRSLPIDAEIRIFELLHLMKGIGARTAEKTVPVKNRLDEEMQKLQKRLHRQYIDTTLKLIKMDETIRNYEETYRHAGSILINIEELSPVLAPGSAEAHMLEAKRKDKLNKMNRSNEAVRLELQIKKELLLAEAKLISQYVATNA
jgi:plasmid maintenance system antidote protein VapI